MTHTDILRTAFAAVVMTCILMPNAEAEELVIRKEIPFSGRDAVYNSANRTLYALNCPDGCELWAYDVSAGELLPPPIDWLNEEAGPLFVNPLANVIYIRDDVDGFRAVDGSTHEEVGGFGAGGVHINDHHVVAVHERANRMYIAGRRVFFDGQIRKEHVINAYEADTLKFVASASISDTESFPALAVDRKTGRLYLNSNPIVGGGFVTVFDGTTLAQLASIELSNYAQVAFSNRLEINSITRRLYAYGVGNDAVDIIDLDGNTIINTVTVPECHKSAVSLRRGYAYVTSSDDHEIYVINRHNEIDTSVAVGNGMGLSRLMVNQLTGSLYATHGSSDFTGFAVISARDHRVTQEIEMTVTPDSTLVLRNAVFAIPSHSYPTSVFKVQLPRIQAIGP
ncbi:MAG: hypothetical protein OEM62_07580 [Acidobacteriota bacterium]|nr:hypothetical protein [Acidobacteriota bacterium]